MIKRHIYKQITNNFFKGKAILIFGPRQTGKTTLLKKLIENTDEDVLFLNGDDFDVVSMFEKVNTPQIKALTFGYKYVFIDEAQRILNVGIAIKIMVDNFPQIQVVATGSSVLGLADYISEPLTGRIFEYHLFPLSFAEMVAHSDFFSETRHLEERIIYGAYPEIITTVSEREKRLKTLSSSYLYKDILEFDKIKKSHVIVKLLQAIALQTGSQVSYNELSQTVGIDSATVEKYIDLLEKSYVIYRLTSFSRNYRNELKKSKKIYFYDTGIRNAIIGNFNKLDIRTDKGALWENFFITERIKKLIYTGFYGNYWFWRTRNQSEIDFIEEQDGRLTAYEIKWNPNKKVHFPDTFKAAYPNSVYRTVNTENFHEYLI